MEVNSDYLHCNFERDRLDANLATARKVLGAMNFKAMACRGVSGLMFTSILSYQMNKGLVVVRKRGESSHSCLDVEGCFPTGRGQWVIVDDFISSGETVAEIIKKMGKTYLSRLLGAYLYKDQRFLTLEELRKKYVGIAYRINCIENGWED